MIGFVARLIGLIGGACGRRRTRAEKAGCRRVVDRQRERAVVDPVVIGGVGQEVGVLGRQRHLRRHVGLSRAEDVRIILTVAPSADVVGAGGPHLAGDDILGVAAEGGLSRGRRPGADQELVLGVHRTVHVIAGGPGDRAVVVLRQAGVVVIKLGAVGCAGQAAVLGLVHRVPQEGQGAQRPEARHDRSRRGAGARPGVARELEAQGARRRVDERSDGVARAALRVRRHGDRGVGVLDPGRRPRHGQLRGRAGRSARRIVCAGLPPR